MEEFTNRLSGREKATPCFPVRETRFMVFPRNSNITLFRAKNALPILFLQDIFMDFSQILKTWSGPTRHQMGPIPVTYFTRLL
jgi:hypothetical protein